MTRTFPPGPKFRFSLFYVLRRTLDPLNFFTTAVRDHGDFVHLRSGSPEIFLLNDPAEIKRILITEHQRFSKGQGLARARRLLGDGLLTSEGDFHHQQRRLVQPAFNHSRIGGYAETMVDFAERASSRWKTSTISISDEMMRLTLGIVAKTLFDADIESEARAVGKALTDTMRLFPRYFLPFADLLERLPLRSNRRFREAKEYLDSTIYRMIDDRRRSGADNGDLLSMLLLAQDEEAGGQRMTDVQVRDEAMTLFLAGYETTSNALTWTWYLLSRNPDIQQRLHRELDEVIADRLPGIQDLPQLRYTNMVFSEAMRLFPPAWVIGRRALEDFTIRGYVIPKDSLVLMSQWVTHRDPRFFPEPERFDPERWTDEARERRPRFSYYPFGGGPRVCVGEGFAWMEGVLLLAVIARRWKMLPAGDRPVIPQALVTLRPKNGLAMQIEARR